MNEWRSSYGRCCKCNEEISTKIVPVTGKLRVIKKSSTPLASWSLFLKALQASMRKRNEIYQSVEFWFVPHGSLRPDIFHKIRHLWVRSSLVRRSRKKRQKFSQTLFMSGRSNVAWTDQWIISVVHYTTTMPAFDSIVNLEHALQVAKGLVSVARQA